MSTPPVETVPIAFIAWACDTCFLVNKATADVCIACCSPNHEKPHPCTAWRGNEAICTQFMRWLMDIRSFVNQPNHRGTHLIDPIARRLIEMLLDDDSLLYYHGWIRILWNTVGKAVFDSKRVFDSKSVYGKELLALASVNLCVENCLDGVEWSTYEFLSLADVSKIQKAREIIRSLPSDNARAEIFRNHCCGVCGRLLSKREPHCYCKRREPK
jgi:hypothetical protein